MLISFFSKTYTHTFIKFGYFNRDKLRLLVALQLIESGFVLNKLAEEERQQFLVIPRLGEILAESLKTIPVSVVIWPQAETHTLSSVFLMDIFCALTKLCTATEMAISISSDRTYSRRDIFALASAIRIMLSR